MKSSLVRGAMASWKTTALGIVQALVVLLNQLSLALDSSDLTNPDWNLIVASLGVALALALARDNDKSSESVGAK